MPECVSNSELTLFLDGQEENNMPLQINNVPITHKLITQICVEN